MQNPRMTAERYTDALTLRLIVSEQNVDDGNQSGNYSSAITTALTIPPKINRSLSGSMGGQRRRPADAGVCKTAPRGR